MTLKKSILIYGLTMGLLMVGLQMLEFQYSLRNISVEMLIGILALIFVVIGFILGRKSGTSRNKTDKNEEELILKRIEVLGISGREYEVLKLINKGLSNKEIAETLFISISTVKSHISKLFDKLESSRRTQLVQKAKELNLLN